MRVDVLAATREFIFVYLNKLRCKKVSFPKTKIYMYLRCNQIISTFGGETAKGRVSFRPQLLSTVRQIYVNTSDTRGLESHVLNYWQTGKRRACCDLT
jgi:hypothetical protein